MQVNSKLVQLLVQQGGEVPTEKNEEEKNVLHIMAEQCCTTSMTELIHILAGQVRRAKVGEIFLPETYVYCIRGSLRLLY